MKNRTFSNIGMKNATNTFSFNSFKLIGDGFKNNSFKRKVSEVLLIKQIKPSLNVQEKSIELNFFN